MPTALQTQSPVDDNVLNSERVLGGFLEGRLITNRGGIEYSDISPHAFSIRPRSRMPISAAFISVILWIASGRLSTLSSKA